MSDSVVRSRIDPETKAKAGLVFSRMGLTMSEAIRLFLHQAVAQQALPFQVRLPNKETRRALAELDDLDSLKFYPTVEAMTADMEAED